MFKGELFRLSQLIHLHLLRFAQFNGVPYLKNRFAISLPNMYMNRKVFVTVEKESEAIFLENSWHYELH